MGVGNRVIGVWYRYSASRVDTLLACVVLRETRDEGRAGGLPVGIVASILWNER